ncbi:MAG: ROK family protein [Synergistaceae bacterium]|jgi:glucokinase|nr:ROK family protein [Synergistaceae bacterium]
MRATGVDLGGHKVMVGLLEGNVIRNRIEEKTESSRTPESVLAQVADMVRRVGGGGDVPTGVCIPGSLDASRERVLMMPNFAGWNGLPIRRMLEERTGGFVAVENDANAFAIGEGFAGLARGMEDFIVLTLGTGIGGGIVSGGRLLTGAHGMAGEPGHIVLGQDELCGPGCGGLGHFEALCGADALERKALEAGLGSPPDLRALWLRRTEPSVAPLWDFALSTVARGVASLIHIFDPELFIVAGGLSRGEGFIDLLKARLSRYLGEAFRRVAVVRLSLLGTDAPVLGAAKVALERREK